MMATAAGGSKVGGVRCQVSGVSPAPGSKFAGKTERRNFDI